MESKYNFKEIEEKWNRRWEREKTYQPDLVGSKRPFYNLMMFPYPSGEGLHVGNCFAFIGSDIQARWKKAQGYDVIEPMGFDAFGMHSENFALKMGTHPWDMTPQNIQRFRDTQLKRVGNMFDWSHEVSTTDPEYYRWTQWIFLKLYEARLAFRKNAEVNWCPSCKTVLANEQVEGWLCERCDTIVEKRSMEQWFFRITAYAQKLLGNLEWIDWSETTKNIQRNWIGRSDGAEITFTVEKSDEELKVFTTRPDTLLGATFMVLAPEHPFVSKLTVETQKIAMASYLRECATRSQIQREYVGHEKTGVFTGSYAVHPAKKRIPIWVSDYVLMSYGSGAIMAVPAHDERDFEFAKTFDLPIVQVISPDGKVKKSTDFESAYSGEGRLVNSGPFDDQSSADARKEIIHWLSNQGKGKARVTYRLHDWCISRQRYWGTPIPIVFCDHCGIVPVPEKDLPVILPFLDNYEPDGSGNSPLTRDPDFLNVDCPKCAGAARRETDVMDNFVDSSWYFLRYLNSQDSNRAFDEKLIRKWLPVDMYVGGNEHAVRHLLYTRFITMVFHDMGLIGFSEPFKRFRANGIILKDGTKMSKSKGNVVIPDEYLDRYGADVFRTYLMFAGDYRQGGDFRDKNIVGIQRFLERLWRYATQTEFTEGPVTDKSSLSLMHKNIKKVTEDIDSLHYNTAIAAIMEFFQGIVGKDVHYHECITTLLKLLSPFAPFVTHELWEFLGKEGMLSDQSWPEHDESLTVDEKVEIVLQVNGRIRDRIELPVNTTQNEVEDIALSRERIRAYLKNRGVSKMIFVPDRLLNIVVK